MSKHTPGPWEVDHEGYVVGSTGKVVCRTLRNVFRDEVDDANFCLIAAAPELLEALKETLEVLESKEFKDEMGLASTMHIRAGSKGYKGKMLPIANIANVIKKAEGEDESSN